ncbi:MAG TPA: amidohydrolase family protein [Methanothermobacter sp.]|nr:predicted chlorohydrolase [Methanothermobacter sp. MT-2]HHW05405.1 amidohydrolase family protein [Methanothermobacter sp.]HOK73160.1 amidohydrolase family protein [Methanothermobacter sp.]HOL68792.1 amidohydrolase family protein [Methanothermobacter sp.]HPQ04685.1 amidohydrolase family protein [Methanothermobacter sp.]
MLVIENGIVLKGLNLKPERVNIAIEDDKIIEISREKIPSDHKIDAKGCIIAPGFINAHVHIADSILKDVGDGKNIDEIVKPPNGLKHKMLQVAEDDEIIESIKDSIIEMISTGTTTFIDYREGGIKGIKLLKNALKDSPINPIILGRDPIFLEENPDTIKLKNRIKKLLKFADGIGPSGFGEISDETAKIIVDECEKRDKIASIHVAETTKAQKLSIEKTGKSEVERAIKAGFHLLVHLTNPVSGDLQLLSENATNIVACPRSNGMLSTGIPPIAEIHKNANILLGTDNVMFNAPDMLREMEYTLKVTRAYNRGYFHPRDVLKMATINMHRFTGHKIGCISEGFQADIIIAESLSKNPYLSLINRSQSKNIRYVIIKGRIVER